VQGVTGLRRLLAQRKEVATHLRDSFAKLAAKHGERVLDSRRNHISFGMTIDVIAGVDDAAARTSLPSVATSTSTVEPEPSVCAAPALGVVTSSAATSTGAATATELSESSAIVGGDGAVKLPAASLVTGDVATSPRHGYSAASASAGSGASSLPAANSFRPSSVGASTMSVSAAELASHRPSVGASTVSGGTEASGARVTSAAARATYLGSMLFSRGVSGTRVVHPAATSTIDGRKFTGYGSQCEGGYPHAYITVAAAMGMTRDDVDVLMGRLDKTIGEFRKQRSRADAGLPGHATEPTEAASAPAASYVAPEGGAGAGKSAPSPTGGPLTS
jgi:hypothetical protein